jgi:hypothetical protein
MKIREKKNSCQGANDEIKMIFFSSKDSERTEKNSVFNPSRTLRLLWQLFFKLRK